VSDNTVDAVFARLKEIDRKLDILIGAKPEFKLSAAPAKKQAIYVEIVSMFEEEFKAYNPKFRIRSMTKWIKDARKLENLGYSLEDLREMVKFVLEDESENGDWKGWRHVVKNIEDFCRSAGKIESAMARQNEYASTDLSPGRNWL